MKRLNLFRFRLAYRAGSAATWALRKGFPLAARELARTAARFALRAIDGRP